LIRDASFQPLRKCERATTFKEVKDKGTIKFEPCAPSDPNGVKKKFMDLTGDQLKLPDVDIVIIVLLLLLKKKICEIG